MIPTNVFVERFRAVTGGSLPTTLVERWQQVIESCEEGYDQDLDELRFDLCVRDGLERVLHDGPLQECPQLRWIRERVAALDLRFRSLLQLDVVMPGAANDPWWLRHPLRYAEAQTVDAYARYGIPVDVRAG